MIEVVLGTSVSVTPIFGVPLIQLAVRQSVTVSETCPLPVWFLPAPWKEATDVVAPCIENQE